MPTVNLTAFVDTLQLQSEMAESVIDVTNGEIFFISEEALRYVENNETDYPDWQEEDVKTAQNYVLNPHQFISFPSKDEVNEYQMMVDFASNIDNQTQRERLFFALNGKGVFRRFKNLIRILQIEKAWYDFKDEQYRHFAREWCEENGFNCK